MENININYKVAVVPMQAKHLAIKPESWLQDEFGGIIQLKVK
jgi:hypothetical protein